MEWTQIDRLRQLPRFQAPEDNAVVATGQLGGREIHACDHQDPTGYTCDVTTFLTRTESHVTQL